MKPQLGDIWRWSPYDGGTTLLLVLRYNETSQTYLCLELEEGKFATYYMDTNNVLYADEWECVA